LGNVARLRPHGPQKPNPREPCQTVKTRLENTLAEMLAEFESNRLEVVLVPQRRFTNIGGCIRVAVAKNCAWYRDFCATYPSTRKRKKAAFDTAIRRENTLRALRGLVAGDCHSKYAPHLLAIARARCAVASRKTAASEAAASEARAMTLRVWVA
jgi:hypothetical protein